MALTPRQRAFVAEYLIDLNAAAAARRAGYSEDVARQIGSENLSKPDVQAALAEAMRERAERCQMRADEVLLRLARIARANMQDYATWGPDGVTLKDSATMPAGAAACVSEVGQTVTRAGVSLRFKLCDKVAALELLGRHLGLFKDVHEHVFPGGIPFTPDEARAGREAVERHRRERLNGSANGTPDAGAPG